MLFGLLEWAIAWVFPILFFACIIPAFYYNDSKSYGASTSFMIISAVLAGIYFKNDISTILGTHSMALTVAFLAGAYIAAGFLTSFVYFIFFNWKAKERYEELLNAQDIPAWARTLASATSDFSDDLKLSIRKYMVIVDRYNQKSIFQDPCGNLNINVDDLGIQDRRQDNMDGGDKLRFREMILTEVLDKVVSDVLPPRFKTCKPFIIGAGCSWPITIICTGKADRTEILNTAKRELEILQEFLPVKITNLQIQKDIGTLMSDLGLAKEMKSMGPIGKALAAKYGQQYEGKQVAEVFKEMMV